MPSDEEMEMGIRAFASRDGSMERPDMQLAKDREHNNRPPKGYTRWDDYHADEALKANANSYGTSSAARPIAEIVQGMLEVECYLKLMLCSEVAWPEDEDYTICSAVEEACIVLGLDYEEFAPTIHHLGNEIEIRLVS